VAPAIDETPKTEPAGQGDVIECACGCGESLRQFDEWKRERKYLPGHNSPLWRARRPAS